MTNLTRTADYLAASLAHLGFIILSQGGGKGLPLVAFHLDNSKEKLHFDEFDVAHHLRQRGWVVPAYTMAPHSESLKLMRVVVREDFSRARCDSLVMDIKHTLDTLKKIPAKEIETATTYACAFCIPSVIFSLHIYVVLGCLAALAGTNEPHICSQSLK